MNVSRWALKHPIPVLIITSGAVFFGIIALLSLNREFVPSMVMPTATVVTLWPGASAETVERDLTSPLEDHFATVPGLRDMQSESRESVSVIKMEFSEDVSLEDSLEELRSRTDLAESELPDDLPASPAVSAWGSGDLPIFVFAISSPWGADQSARFVNDQVIPEIYRVEGVAQARVLGEQSTQIEIRLNPTALLTNNISALEVYGAIQGRNVVLPAGLVDWDGGQWAFRTTGEFQTLHEIERLVVGASESRRIQLQDVAEIREVYEEPQEHVRSQNDNHLVVQITKRESGNSLTMSKEIRQRLADLEANGAYRFTVLHDDSETIRLSLGTVANSALTGIVMAIGVIWLFLRNWRYTLVVAISLPVSLVMTFAGMRVAGLSMNVLTMAGITVSLGMVVDASIVVLENIHRRRSEGQSPDDAAMEGASLVSGAVFASTTTSVSVFAPMIFLDGVIGSILKDLSLTLVLSLSSSLFAALLIVPPLVRRGLNQDDSQEESHSVQKNFPKGMMARLERRYAAGLRQSLKMSGSVFFAAGCILVISVLAADLMGLSFIPSADYSEIFVSIELPPGSDLETTTQVVDELEGELRRLVPEAKEVTAYAGMEDDLTGEVRVRERAWIQMILVPPHSRQRDSRSVIDELNSQLPQVFPGLALTVFNGGFDRMLAIGTDGAGFRVELSSESLTSLNEAAAQVEQLLLDDSDILSTARDVNNERKFVTAVLDGEALGRLGVSAQDVALTTRIAFEGVDVGDYRPTNGLDQNIRLNSQFDGVHPDSSRLGLFPLRSHSGQLISLNSVTDIESGSGVSGIRRRDRARTLTVIGYTKDEDIRGVTRRFREALAIQGLPSGVEWRLQGVGGLIGDSMGRLFLVLLASLFLVYAVMAIQFERLLQPLVIMASVPFSFIGVVGGLALFGSDISLIAFLGIVALAGIVVNNAIVQVDQMNRLRQEGLALEEAVVKGAVSRLRPILMTTLTTFFGVLPLSLAQGAGARIYAPLGQAIAGGLITSTLVTLFLVPTLYHSLENGRFKRRNMMRTKKETKTGVA